MSLTKANLSLNICSSPGSCDSVTILIIQVLSLHITSDMSLSLASAFKSLSPFVKLPDIHAFLLFPSPHNECTPIHLKPRQQQLPSSLQFSAQLFKTHMPHKILGSREHMAKSGISIPHANARTNSTRYMERHSAFYWQPK